MTKIYLAGPDIFRADADVWAESARRACRRHGFEPLLPIDHGEVDPKRIFAANVAMIREAAMVVANLDPFRGAEPDSGTAFEIGYAVALGKPVWGYVAQLDNVVERVEIAGLGAAGPSPDGLPRDHAGARIENFGLPCNLMLAVPAQVVEGSLDACLDSIRRQLAPARKAAPGAVISTNQDEG
jgi:nucleoside 2-deoxyribosyltransferase